MRSCLTYFKLYSFQILRYCLMSQKISELLNLLLVSLKLWIRFRKKYFISSIDNLIKYISLFLWKLHEFLIYWTNYYRWKEQKMIDKPNIFLSVQFGDFCLVNNVVNHFKWQHKRNWIINILWHVNGLCAR